MSELHAEFVMCDIETLGTPRECGTTFIAMPNAAFVAWQGFDVNPHVYYAQFNVQDQLDAGAKVNARTVAFWLNEALRGNHAADLIVSALDEVDTESTTQFYAPLKVSEEYKESDSTVYDLLQEVLSKYGNVPHYGNGPDFDQIIYSTVVANVSKDTPEIWGFSQTSSARTLKELYRDAGENYEGLANESFEYAERIMKESGFLEQGHTASKHNPVFDALAEAFVVASIKQYFLK